MNKFQILEAPAQFNHAGTKATADIAVIAGSLGFRKLLLQMRTTKKGYFSKIKRQWGYCIDWNSCYSTIVDDAVVLLQHPFHYPQFTRERVLYALKRRKHVKFISIVHDVEELRGFRFNDYYKREFEVMLDIADIIIVHNALMKQFFIEQGVDKNRLIDIEIFDYLQDGTIEKKVEFEKAITVAGNLDTTKCRYIGQLGRITGVKINLFGPNFNEDMKQLDNVEYHGSFPVDEIPRQLKTGFGLVWDGESIQGCKGLSGQYLKYNNPHKLSLYLSSGMPVVIWSGAAEAQFVRENGVGICVESLCELEALLSNMTVEEYQSIRKNVCTERDKLVQGYYSKKAIEYALMRI
nr:hypothetical protein [uncultured Acetatifactor sp.]